MTIVIIIIINATKLKILKCITIIYIYVVSCIYRCTRVLQDFRIDDIIKAKPPDFSCHNSNTVPLATSLLGIWELRGMFSSSLHPVVCFIYVICVCLCIVVFNTYCVQLLFCLFSSCVPYVADFSGLSIFDGPFGIL